MTFSGMDESRFSVQSREKEKKQKKQLHRAAGKVVPQVVPTAAIDLHRRILPARPGRSPERPAQHIGDDQRYGKQDDPAEQRILNRLPEFTSRRRIVRKE